MTDTTKLVNYPIPFEEVADGKIYIIDSQYPISDYSKILEIKGNRFRIVRELGQAHWSLAWQYEAERLVK